MTYPKSTLGRRFLKKADLLRDLDPVLVSVEEGLVPSLPNRNVLIGNASGVTTVRKLTLEDVHELTTTTTTTLAALTGQTVGSVVYVISRKRYYIAVPVGQGDIPGVGVSWRSDPSTSSQTWLTQATWSIDGTNGNDDNSGIDDAHALKTAAELYARLGAKYWVWPQSVTLRVLTNIDPLFLEFEFASTGMQLQVVGVPTLLTQGTIASWTAFAGNVSARITLTGIADWTPYVNKRLRIVGGARDNAVSWVAQVNPNGAGANVAATLQGFKPISWAVSPVSPVVADVVYIEDLPTVPYVLIRCKSSDGTLEMNNSTLRLMNLNIERLDFHGLTTSYAGCNVNGSYVHHFYSYSTDYASAGSPILKFTGCRLNPDLIGNVYTDCCLISQTNMQLVYVTGHWQAGHDLVQGPYIMVVGSNGFLDSSLGSFGVQETVSTFGGAQIRVQHGGRIYVASNLYGQTSAAIVGVSMYSSGTLLWLNSRPSITGLNGDVRLGPSVEGSRFTVSWANTNGYWNDGAQNGTVTLGAGGTVAVTVPFYDTTKQSITATYRDPGVNASILSVPVANRNATGFTIKGAATDNTSTVDWAISPLGYFQQIGKL